MTRRELDILELGARVRSYLFNENELGTGSRLGAIDARCDRSIARAA